jgi:hypothetical protein
VLAIKNTQTLIVEAKGAKGATSSPVTKRKKFDSGQIKGHFGRALVKCLEEKARNQGAMVAIAQPDDPFISGCLSDAVGEARKIGIKFFWVAADGSVEME